MVGFLGVAALVTFVFCVPFLSTRLALLEGEETREQLLEEKKIPIEALEAFARSREAALDWKIISTTWDDLALVSLRRAALADKNSGAAKEQVRRGVLLQKRALALSPADPYGWLRLAYLSEMAGLRLEAGEALKASIKADPYAHRLFRARFDLALRLGNAVDKETQDHMPKLLLAAFKSHPPSVIYAAQEGYSVGVMQEMLAPYPEELKRFNDLLRDSQ